MVRWGIREPVEREERQKIDKVKCGTAGCALGWATGMFPDETGFFLHFNRLDEIASIIYINDEGVHFEGGEAGSEFFSMNTEQASSLFYPSSYEVDSERIQPKHVSKRITWMLDNDGSIECPDTEEYGNG